MAGEESTPWPQRTTTELQDGTSQLDISVWDDLMPHVREGDIVINAFMKSGTNWMTQVILQMINHGEETLFYPENTVRNAAPYVENFLVESPKDVVVAKFKPTPPHHRRVVKSHIQLDALLFSPKLKYVGVFRDGRDNMLSFYNQTRSLTAEFLKRTHRASPDDFDNFYDNWLHGNRPFWCDYFHYLQSWWNYSHCDNILFINYNEMKLDLTSVVLKLAKFLDIDVGEPASTGFQNILHHSSFPYMKQHAELFEPPPQVMHPGTFFHRGEIGRWRHALSESQHQAYWDKISQRWSPELIDFVHNESLLNVRP